MYSNGKGQQYRSLLSPAPGSLCMFIGNCLSKSSSHVRFTWSCLNSYTEAMSIGISITWHTFSVSESPWIKILLMKSKGQMKVPIVFVAIDRKVNPKVSEGNDHTANYKRIFYIWWLLKHWCHFELYSFSEVSGALLILLLIHLVKTISRYHKHREWSRKSGHLATWFYIVTTESPYVWRMKIYFHDLDSHISVIIFFTNVHFYLRLSEGQINVTLKYKLTTITSNSRIFSMIADKI